MRRVVVTGTGLVTPLGCGTENNWEQLINSKSGIRAIQSFDVTDLPAKIAGQVPRGETAEGRFNAEDYVPQKDQRRMDNFILFAIAAAELAVSDAGWKPTDDEDRERTGVLVGSGIGGLSEIAKNATLADSHQTRKISPFFIPASLINLSGGHISIRFGFKGPNHAVVTACATGAHAICDSSQLRSARVFRSGSSARNLAPMAFQSRPCMFSS